MAAGNTNFNPGGGDSSWPRLIEREASERTYSNNQSNFSKVNHRHNSQQQINTVQFPIACILLSGRRSLLHSSTLNAAHKLFGGKRVTSSCLASSELQRDWPPWCSCVSVLMEGSSRDVWKRCWRLESCPVSRHAAVFTELQLCAPLSWLTSGWCRLGGQKWPGHHIQQQKKTSQNDFFKFETPWLLLKWPHK